MKRTTYGWKAVATLLNGTHTQPPGGKYLWNVTDAYEPGKGYALWLAGEHYADLTKWFMIVEEPKEESGSGELKV